ncbi:MAG: hypothetical protein ACMZ7B_04530 [Balneola sp.]
MGKNFARIRDFKKLIFYYWSNLTEVDKRNIQDTEESLLEFFDYKVPLDFKSIKEKVIPNKSYLILYIGVVILILGIFFGYLKHLDLFVAFTRQMVFSFFLWFAIYFGAKHGNIHSYRKLKRVTFIAVFFFYFFQILIYHSLNVLSTPESINFIQYLGEQLSVANNELLDRIGQKFIVIGLSVGFISYFFFLNLKLSISKLKKKEIPNEVLLYTEYLVAKGESNYQIKNNLTKKGITDYQFHNRILEVLRSKEGMVS